MGRYNDPWTPEDPFKLVEDPHDGHVTLRVRNPMWDGHDNIYRYTPSDARPWHYSNKYVSVDVDYEPSRSFQKRLMKGRRKVSKLYKKAYGIYLGKQAAREHAEKHLGGDDG